MTIELRISVGIEPGETIPAFYGRRKRLLGGVSDHFRRLEPVFEDIFLVFRGLTYGERKEIESYCGRADGGLDLHPKAVYAAEEIDAAAYVPLLVKYDEIDFETRHLNEYPRGLCEWCGSCDLANVPRPYVVQRPGRKSAIFNAGNGLRIITRALWEELEGMLGEWVNVGLVAVAPLVETPSADLLWMRPRETIGANVNAVTLQSCESCGRPTEVRMRNAADVLLWSMDVVKDFGACRPPIALLGNWYGEVHPGTPPRVSWNIAITGEVHRRLRKMKVRGFAAADRVIHAESELAALFGA